MEFQYTFKKNIGNMTQFSYLLGFFINVSTVSPWIPMDAIIAILNKIIQLSTHITKSVTK